MTRFTAAHLASTVPDAVRRLRPEGRPPVLLELDLSRGLLEARPTDQLSALRSRHIPTVRNLQEQLRRAERDSSVAGLVAQLGPQPLTASQAEELGAAVERFGATGRPTLCWTDSFGELGTATAAYLLAAFFDEVWLQPSGSLGLLGVAARGVFVRPALDRLGVEPQLAQRHEYKSAADLFLRSSMSEPNREALQGITDSMLEQVVSTTARRRDLAADQVRAAVDRGPLSAQQALDAQLVDRLGYRDEAYAELRRRLGVDGRLELRYVQRWSPPPVAAVRERLRDKRRPVVAVVTINGGISRGRSGSSPLNGPHAGADTVTAALRTAGERDDVRAVVLRVVSPGGSYVASDAIRRAVLQLRATGRPVVASMGSVAASGGYFVAMPCDEVVATPSTITGSIGVLGGKLVVRQALSRWGIEVESVGSGEHATMFGADRRFDEEEWRRVDEWLDAVYADFTAKAAQDRSMAYDRLEPLARGRIWSGADALNNGLVDRLGDLRTAAERAATLAGVEPGAVRLRSVPHLTPMQRLSPPKSSESPTAAAGTAGSDLLGGPESLLRAVWSSVAQQPVHGVLTMPGAWQLT
jgi:protease-4